MNSKGRALVISNCQCLPLASWLTLLSKDMVFDFWGVHLLKPETRSNEIDEYCSQIKNTYDVILSISLSEEFGAVSDHRIASTLSPAPIIKISNIYFSGLHPDLCYIGGLGSRVVGPLVDYHSKVTLYSYLNNLDVPNAISHFNDDVYKQANFYSEFEESMATLRNRDEKVDVRVTDILPEIIKEKFCFFSVNHPTPSVFSLYCNDIINFMQNNGLCSHSGVPVDLNIGSESLASNCIFPVYPQIAEKHGIPQFGSLAFKPAGSRVNPINLEEFIRQEYACFDTFGKEALAATWIGKQVLSMMPIIQQ